MRKLYFFLLMALAACMPLCLSAQGKTTGKVYIGYAPYNEPIWEWDGLSLDFDARVGCAIVLTRDMLEPYIGGTVTGLRVGWDTSTENGTYEGFIRTSFDGEDLATGTATVRYDYNSTAPGWNDLKMTSYEIPEDVQQLVVGFTTQLKKGLCAIPTLYPHDVANSCYLWVEGDVDENGRPVWVDMKDRGILPIQLAVKDTQGSFNFLPAIKSVVDNGVVETATWEDCLLRISNAGSQTIRSIELTSRQGEQQMSRKVTLSKAVTPGTTSGMFLAPIYCFQSGDVELSITKVNDSSLEVPASVNVSLIGVPEAVANEYERRPLVEYFESENNYRSPRYYDEYIEPSLRNFTDEVTFVCQHMDDQFMTGDDDATALSLRLCGGDSLAVSIPAMTHDRSMNTGNILFQQNSSSNPMFSVLLDPYAGEALRAAIGVPTFVAVQAIGHLGADGESLEVNVSGDVAEGVMPEGDDLCVTAYLMERNVFSDSQLFWTEEEKEETKGVYTHANVIREILSPVEGEPIGREGDFAVRFSSQIDPSWSAENLYLVAFVHRDGKKGYRRMQVLNSCEGEIDFNASVSRLDAARTERAMFDLQGRRLTTAPARGIYILNGKKVVR